MAGLRKNERIKLTEKLINAGWDTVNVRRGVAVRLVSSPTKGECGQITYRFGPVVALDMLYGLAPVPSPKS